MFIPFSENHFFNETKEFPELKKSSIEYFAQLENDYKSIVSRM
ncbi:hypothetical protein FACS1894113_5410 [Alphaproteobacteria bacterium]|nr:hypothetical protein FACS1894113_5410 [Alphaproteobacteria bacterium]